MSEQLIVQVGQGYVEVPVGTLTPRAATGLIVELSAIEIYEQWNYNV